MKALYGSWQEHLNQSGKADSDPVVMPWLFSKPFRQQHPEKVREIKAHLTGGYLPKNSEAFERQLKSNVTHDTRDALKRLKVPTLIMAGRDDVLTPPRMAEELASQIPDAELEIFEHGGHGLYWEIPGLFNEKVLAFLDRSK